MPLPSLIPEYEEHELFFELRTYHLSSFAQTMAERKLCLAIDIIRWMVSVAVESNSNIFTGKASTAILQLVLANIPNAGTANAETQSQVREAISVCDREVGTSRRCKTLPSLLDILESPLVVRSIWSRLNTLLYRPIILEERDSMVLPLVQPIEQVARDGLIVLEDPRQIGSAVQAKLAATYDQVRNWYRHRNPTPPLFIRALWENPQYGDKLTKDFKIRVCDSKVKEERITHSVIHVTYRLVCLVKINSPEEEPYAPQLYTKNGRMFSYRQRENPKWTQDDPGKYYLIYHKARETRDIEKQDKFENELNLLLMSSGMIVNTNLEIAKPTGSTRPQLRDTLQAAISKQAPILKGPTKNVGPHGTTPAVTQDSMRSTTTISSSKASTTGTSASTLAKYTGQSRVSSHISANKDPRSIAAVGSGTISRRTEDVDDKDSHQASQQPPHPTDKPEESKRGPGGKKKARWKRRVKKEEARDGDEPTQDQQKSAQPSHQSSVGLNAPQSYRPPSTGPFPSAQPYVSYQPLPPPLQEMGHDLYRPQRVQPDSYHPPYHPHYNDERPRSPSRRPSRDFDMPYSGRRSRSPRRDDRRWEGYRSRSPLSRRPGDRPEDRYYW
ncbi:hypothetical protein F5Y04DRAFT_279530 [Hypomontagnella monticulosa]|nr:hypothetical protein F5Y04DRAFT_279530 [Hypomontagnella monticulosa]